MTTAPLGRIARRPEDAIRAIAIRSRLASIGLVLLLLSVSAFAIWSSRLTADSARDAVRSSKLSDDYAKAAKNVAAEESLERKYRLDPGPRVRSDYAAAARDLVKALGDVARDGDAADRTLVDHVLAEHRAYLAADSRMFDAVDRGDLALARRIDITDVDASFGSMEHAVTLRATKGHAVALIQLEELQRLERMTGSLTPVVFVVGLLLALLLGWVTRGYRRLLDSERAQAVNDSLHDALTGLPNRTLLADSLSLALHAGREAGTATGLLLIDLDRFKEVNDTFGHHYGDELLIQVGPRLVAALNGAGTVARLGGDEFAVLLPDVGDVAAAMATATRLRRALEAPFCVDGVELDVEASIGVVLSGVHGEDPSTLLQRADIAMYAAKAENLGVSAYDPDLDGHSPAKLALLGDLRRALDRDELVLHYQPKINVSTGEVVGAEALVRWAHPERGLIFPDAFIPLAEHTGLIGPLSSYVLDAALAQARRWADAGRAVMVSVNLSARNLLDEGLPEEVASLLAVHGVAADLLELEVTESAIMTEPVRAQRLLERLAALGVRISIDDFGAGYTSLGQLRSLPVTELKIDRSFVMTMTEDRSSALIVHSVVELGHNLGLTIVAEGVETEAALRALARFGCDIAQGYHLSRPVPVEDFDAWCIGRTFSTSSPAPARPMGVSAG